MERAIILKDACVWERKSHWVSSLLTFDVGITQPAHRHSLTWIPPPFHRYIIVALAFYVYPDTAGEAGSSLKSFVDNAAGNATSAAA